MSAKYSLLVVAIVAAILTLNSLWIKHTNQNNSANDMQQVKSES